MPLRLRKGVGLCRVNVGLAAREGDGWEANGCCSALGKTRIHLYQEVDACRHHEPSQLNSVCVLEGMACEGTRNGQPCAYWCGVWNAARWYIPLRQVMHRRRADRSLVSGVGFWWYVGGGEPNRRVALTDCKGDR